MKCAISQSHSRRQCQRVILALMILLLATTVLESVPSSTISFYGHDFYTVAGQKSVEEVFDTPGTYKLHNYSVGTPGCDLCEPAEVMASFGVQIDPHMIDVFSRISTTGDVRIGTLQHSHRVDTAADTSLLGEVVRPESPPPKAISSS